MIREKQDGEDLVFVAVDRTNAQAVTEALRMNGNTGKVSLSTLFQDCWDKSAADGAAGTATAEHTILRAASNLVITAVRYVPDAALTADASNNATIILKRRDASGANATTVASVTTSLTGSGNWVQWVAVNLALAATTLVAGQILTIAITKAASGVVVPAGQLVFDYQIAP